MSKVMIIGAGGVGAVVTHKCAQLPDVFSEIVLASRTESKCKAIAAQLSRPIRTAQVNADNVPELVALLKQERPELVINVALPYQDLTIMDACLEAGVHYLDTANYEPLGHREVRIPLAVGLPAALLRCGPDGDPRQRLRSRRDQHLHGLPRQALLR
jgi:saccharopine dehydrogenase-like NADP-dependent oxidoreductase